MQHLRRTMLAAALAGGVICLLAGNGWAGEVFGSGAVRNNSAGHAYRWSGLYVGAHAGYATGTSDADFPLMGLPASDISLDGVLYGGHLGYNLQIGSTLIGIEGSFSGSSVNGSSGCLVIMTCEREVEWLATIAARFGYVMDRTMLYVLGGIAWSEIATTVSLSGCTCLEGSETNQGWLVGFGMEYAITARLAGRIEYVHVDLGSSTHALDAGGGPTEPARVAGSLDALRLGASLKLGD
jgi:outer membrane immunogenic protein